MTLEYQPTIDDVLRLKRALHSRARRHPLFWMIFIGGCTLAIGGAMMASVASPAWWLLTFAGGAFAAAAWVATLFNAPTPVRVEEEYATSAWLREPFRVEIDADGLHYQHGPYRSRAAWSAFTKLIETDHHLILLERRAPGALAYGLPKRELDQPPGGAATWREFLTSKLRAARTATA